MTTTSNARVRLVRPIHKKMRGSFSFNRARTQKNVIKQIPVMNKARGHENCGSRSGSFIDFRFTGLSKNYGSDGGKNKGCQGELIGNIT